MNFVVHVEFEIVYRKTVHYKEQLFVIHQQHKDYHSNETSSSSKNVVKRRLKPASLKQLAIDMDWRYLLSNTGWTREL